MIVREFCDYAAGLENTLSWWNRFISTKFFMFAKLFAVLLVCSFIIDGLNWLHSEFHLTDTANILLFLSTFLPILIIGYIESFKGTLLFSPVRKIFFIRRLALLASKIMKLEGKITVRDKRKGFVAEDLLQLERLFKKRTTFFISGKTKYHEAFEATYRMTFTPRGGRIIPGTAAGSGGGDRMYIWEIMCGTTLQDCEGSFSYDSKKTITVDNMSGANLSKQSCNNVRRLLHNITDTRIRGHFRISDHELFLTIYDNIRKIKAMPYMEIFRVRDNTEALRQLVTIMDILSGKQCMDGGELP